MGWIGRLGSTYKYCSVYQSILKEINPEYSLEGLLLKLKLQYFGHLIWRANSLGKPWCWERLKAGGEGYYRGWEVGWHHWLNGHEFEQDPGDGEGHGSLVCCSPRDRKELDWATEQQGGKLKEEKTDHLRGFKKLNIPGSFRLIKFRLIKSELGTQGGMN